MTHAAIAARISNRAIVDHMNRVASMIAVVRDPSNAAFADY
jgi:hypothetical protein